MAATTPLREPIAVIGSGPAGAVAARQLTERGLDVVVLDAGVHAPRGLVIRACGNTVFRRMGYADYRSDRLSPSSSPNTVWYSSLSHGGLSNFWTSAVPRFAPDDFSEGARLDERYRWPVAYDELVPFYERAERLLVVTSGDAMLGVPPNVQRYRHEPPDDWRTIVERLQAAGHGAGVIPLAKGAPWMIARRGTEFASYHCVIEPLINAGRLQMMRGAHVLRLVWSPSQGRVSDVEYVDVASGATRRLAVRGVVLAAGTIDTTMILLRSTSSDFPTGLGNANDLVGRYLHDHPREWWRASIERPLRALSHPIYLARGSIAECAPLMATSHTIGLAAQLERLRTYVRATTTRVGVQVFGTMVPRPDCRVMLDPCDEAGPDQRPIVTLAYDAAEVANLESSRARFSELMGLGGARVTDIGPFHELEPGSSVHMAGTVRMHDDPQFGVLDRWNRIHDARDVVVCDMSAFTTGPEKNPTLTAMALAIRAADRLADDLAGRSTT